MGGTGIGGVTIKTTLESHSFRSLYHVYVNDEYVHTYHNLSEACRYKDELESPVCSEDDEVEVTPDEWEF